jgi:hypothetical protein
MKKTIDPIEKYILEKFREMGIKAIPLKEKLIQNQVRTEEYPGRKIK